ncbi:MAG: iron-containing alcohol dehydrogenase [Clostridia bacterium]
MINNFFYNQPVKISFGANTVDNLEKIIKANNFDKGILICDKLFEKNGLANKILANTPSLVAIYSDITPNPMLSEVKKCTSLMKSYNANFAVALGGGSSIDLAKFSCSFFYAELPIEEYFYKRSVFSNNHLPLIAIPTTAGTGSEVTSVSVCNDDTTGTKAPLNCNNFYPYMAIIDSSLTLSVPPFITACTGLDAFSHAIEGYWSKQNQPICDIFAVEAGKLILENIFKAYQNGYDKEARNNLSMGALLAGLSFGLPKTAAVHACSYPLSIDYHLSHGEACAFTLDGFIRANTNERLTSYAKALGYNSTYELADKILELKKLMGLKITLQDANIVNVDKLVNDCLSHPLMQNNPVILTKEELTSLFINLK